MHITDFFPNIVSESNGTDVIDKFPKGYSSEENDQSVLKLSDLRKTRLTLAHLNVLRKMNDTRRVEHEMKLKTLGNQYRPPAQESGGF